MCPNIYDSGSQDGSEKQGGGITGSLSRNLEVERGHSEGDGGHRAPSPGSWDNLDSHLLICTAVDEFLGSVVLGCLMCLETKKHGQAFFVIIIQ